MFTLDGRLKLVVFLFLLDHVLQHVWMFYASRQQKQTQHLTWMQWSVLHPCASPTLRPFFMESLLSYHTPSMLVKESTSLETGVPSCQAMASVATHNLQELSHLEGHGRNICQEDCVKSLSNGDIVCCPQRAVAQLFESESGKTPHTLVNLLTTSRIRPTQDQC